MKERPTDSNRESCPGKEEFVRFFLNKTPAAAGEELTDHLRFCDSCRRKFEILRDVGPALRGQKARLRPLAQASRRELRSRFRSREPRAVWAKYRLFGTVGASLGLVLLGLLLFRNPNAADTLRGSAASLPILAIPQGPLAEAPRLFFWTRFPQGDSYRFELIDDELQTLTTMSTQSGWILIPETVQNRLRSGRTYLWTVEAIRDDNRKIGEIRRYFELR
jgi:hypothetical protein